MVQRKLTPEKEKLALLIREDASRGLMTFEQLKERYGLCNDRLYKILNLDGVYTQISGTRINVLRQRMNKKTAVIQLLFSLNVGMTSIGEYLENTPCNCYRYKKQTTDSKPRVPVRVRHEFRDTDGNPLRAGHYWLTPMSENELWATPLKDKALGGFVVAKTELIGRVETIPGMKYE